MKMVKIQSINVQMKYGCKHNIINKGNIIVIDKSIHMTAPQPKQKFYCPP